MERQVAQGTWLQLILLGVSLFSLLLALQSINLPQLYVLDQPAV
jgi:hypothetical protein